MAGLVSDFASHFTRIGEFHNKLRTIYTETRKMDLLIRALRNVAQDWLVEHLKIHFPSNFEGARNKLIEFEQLKDNNGAQEVTRTKKQGLLLHMTNMLESVLERDYQFQRVPYRTIVRITVRDSIANTKNRMFA